MTPPTGAGVPEDEAALAALDPDRADRSLPALLARRFTGTYEVDPWGFDDDLAALLAPLAVLLPRVEVAAASAIPEVGPALLVMNHRPGPFEPLAVAAALGRSTGRPVRPAGAPDLAVVGPLLRRLGGVPGGAHDLRSLLRSGALVLHGNSVASALPLGDGRPEPAVLAEAAAVGCPVLPVAVRGPVWRRHLRVTVGPAVNRRDRTPTDPESLATLVAHRLADL